MPEIVLPTKATQDLIKQNTNEIKSELLSIGTDLNSVESTIAQGLGTDWSKYTLTQSLYTAATISPYVYEVNGEGFLSTLLIFTTHPYAQDVNVTLEVDGLSNNKNNLSFGASAAYGFCQTNEAAVNSATSGTYICPIASGKVANFSRSGLNRNTNIDLPAQGTVFILDYPIFYKNKLKVTISWGASFAAHANSVFIKGGVAL